MTSNDHDQTMDQQLGRTVRRAYAPLALSADQRRRHHALLDQAARQRDTGQLRAHLTEAATIATIALFIIAGLITWQALQPEDEEQAAAPAASVESTTALDSKIDDPVERQQSLYMLKDGDISAIDPATGAEVLHLDANTRFDYPFESPQLAVSPEAGLVAVADVLGNEDEFELGVKIYRMSDGSLERALSVPTIQRCIGGPCINLLFSQDGQRIHVQQYETQPGEVGNQADYWLGTFDLIEGKWLADVDLQACGALNHLETVGPHEVIALCAKTGLYIVDTEHFTARAAGYRFNSAAMVAHDDDFFVVYHDRTICRQARDGDRTTATCETTAKLNDTEGVAQFSTNLGVSLDGSRLYIPTASSADRGGSRASSTASTIAVITTSSWTVERTIDVGFSFNEIVFSEDASTAYVISEHEDGVARLLRIDLTTGNQTELASGAISSLLIDLRWDAEPVATTPTSPPESDTAMLLDYEVRNYDVVGINPKTGEEMQHIDVNIGLPSPILAVSRESGRIAVGDLLHLQNGGDQVGSSAGGEYGVKVYRMSDGTLEQQIPTAGLVTCREACEVIIFSQDGQRLHIYQRDWPGGADASSIRYLLTTYDLESREWLQDIDVGDCGIVKSWGFVGDQILRIECSSSSPVEVNTSIYSVTTNASEPVEESEQLPSTAPVRYSFRDGDVVGVDRETGQVVQHIDVNIGSQSSFLATSYETGRIAIGDFLRIGDDVEFGVKIYLMSDGSFEQEIPVPTLIRCLTLCEGIIFSEDGQRIHIYQYEIPPEANGNGDHADYWLGTYDLESREWLPDVDMGSCGVMLDWRFIDGETLQVDCADSGPLEIVPPTSAST